ncbi:MAG: hypothetical protein ACR2M6_02630 [Vampirovibrionia bacterium]
MMDLDTYLKLQAILQEHGLYEASELIRETYPVLDKLAQEFVHQCEKDEDRERRKIEQLRKQ